MFRNFVTTNNFNSISDRIFDRAKWGSEAYMENSGVGDKMMKDTNFVELIHYGLIDHENNSVIPNEEFIVNTKTGRVFDFVADSYSLMRLNYGTALRKGLISNEGSLFGNLDMVSSYTNPKVRYGRYLNSIFQYYNETHIPINLGITSITSYDDYVKHFFKLFFDEGENVPLTMTKWNTSKFSSMLDSGLAFSYADIPFDADQVKIDRVVDHPCFEYIKNLSMNMSFSIIHNSPNILLYDLRSPAGASIRNSYGLFQLSNVFENRFVKTHTIDNIELYNNININYNKYVFQNPLIKIVSVKNCKTVSEYVRLETVDVSRRPYTDLEEIFYYIQIRNVEEGNIFRPQTIKNIYKKAKYFRKKVDKPSAMSYINSMFRDQVWNKNNGFHDKLAALKDSETQTRTEAQRQQAEQSTTSYSTTSGGGSGGGSGGSSY